MCKYSIEATIESRGVVNAKKNDHLVLAAFHGFEYKDVSDSPVVCLLPGTELSLSGMAVDFYLPDGKWADRETVDCRNLVVRSEERSVPVVWHSNREAEIQNLDILVRSDGRYAIVRYLSERTTARVIQLPVGSSLQTAQKELELV